jgi:hypothetical protein
MRKFPSIASVLVLSALVVSCSDQSTSPAVDSPDFSAAGPVTHRATMGGADVCEAFGLPTGCDANFSLAAIGYADGTAKGQWQDTFSKGQGAIHVAVDCLIVYGNQAVVGGVVTNANNPVFVGTRALTSVVDNGTSANDVADQISFSFIGFDEGVDCNTPLPEEFPLLDLKNGQAVVVQ